MAAGKSNSEKIAFTKVQRRELADRIKAVRKQRGYVSAEDFANQKNISRAQMGRYEKGHNISLDSLMWLLRQMELTPGEFFGEWLKWKEE